MQGVALVSAFQPIVPAVFVAIRIVIGEHTAVRADHLANDVNAGRVRGCVARRRAFATLKPRCERLPRACVSWAASRVGFDAALGGRGGSVGEGEAGNGCEKQHLCSVVMGRSCGLVLGL